MKNNGKRIFATVIFSLLAAIPFLASAGLHVSSR